MKKRVDEAAETQQVLQRAQELKGLWCGGSRFEVRPIDGDQRFTSVRQNDNELQTVGHARLPEYLQRLSLKWVMRAGDGHPFR